MLGTRSASHPMCFDFAVLVSVPTVTCLARSRWIAGKLELFLSMWLQAKRLPNAVHRRFRQAGLPSNLPGAPARSVFRFRLQRLANQLLCARRDFPERGAKPWPHRAECARSGGCSRRRTGAARRWRRGCRKHWPDGVRCTGDLATRPRGVLRDPGPGVSVRR